MSHLDYSNALLYSLPKKTIKRYHIVRNMCAKLVLGRWKYSSSTDALHCLHWLPIQWRITYKIVLITFKCINKIAPRYLQELITIRNPAWDNMHSNTKGPMLEIPKIKHKTFAARSFKYAAPMTWNSLPDQIRTCNNLANFKSLLKTHLYRQAFKTSRS